MSGSLAGHPGDEARHIDIHAMYIGLDGCQRSAAEDDAERHAAVERNLLVEGVGGHDLALLT